MATFAAPLFGSRPLTLLTNPPIPDDDASCGLAGDDIISAIFRRENISGTSVDIGMEMTQAEWDRDCRPISAIAYERMKPALRRVGEMMQASDPFFVRIIYAEIKQMPEDYCQSDSRRPKTFLDPLFQGANREGWEAYDDMKRYLHTRLRVYMGDNEDCTQPESHACTNFSYQPRPGKLSIHVNPAYLAFFSERDYDLFEEITKNNVLFMLAVTLGHEMAHVMGYVRQSNEYADFCKNYPQRENRPKFDNTEPIYDTSLPESELGRAWEHYMFGGISEFVNKTNALSLKGNLLWINSIKFSSHHSFKLRHRDSVAGKWNVLEEGLINAFFDNETMAKAWQRWQDIKPESVESKDGANILDAIKWVLEQTLERKQTNLLGLEAWQSHGTSLASTLPDISQETKADLEQLIPKDRSSNE